MYFFCDIEENEIQQNIAFKCLPRNSTYTAALQPDVRRDRQDKCTSLMPTTAVVGNALLKRRHGMSWSAGEECNKNLASVLCQIPDDMSLVAELPT